jgi:hypothetical protein
MAITISYDCDNLFRPRVCLEKTVARVPNKFEGVPDEFHNPPMRWLSQPISRTRCALLAKSDDAEVGFLRPGTPSSMRSLPRWPARGRHTKLAPAGVTVRDDLTGV